MSTLMILLLSLSLVALAGLATYRFLQTKSWRPFLAQMLALLLVFAFLRALFDFPAPPPASKGDAQQDIYLIIVLYACMLLGMLAQYGHSRFSAPKKKRKPFDLGLFFAPVFTSPIIFIPLLAALQNAEIDLTRLDAPRFMAFLVAFENGFFWKEYFDHRREEKEKHEN